MARPWKGFLMGAALLGGLTLALPAQTTQKDSEEPLKLAVVDYKVLIKAHPDFDKLQQLDEQLRLLEGQKAQVEREAKSKLFDNAKDKMAKAVAEGRSKLEAEKAAIESELANLSAHLGQQMAAEMQGLQAGYEAQIKKKIEELTGGARPEAPSAPDLNQSMNAQDKEFMENLGLIRERNLAARRLELEKRLTSELEAERSRLDAELGAYEDQLNAQYQSEKLNLQLQVQNSADEEERKAAEARLGEISNEIADKKQARRAEIDSGFGSFRSEKQQAVQSELATYQRELDSEVRQKMVGRGGHSPAPQTPPAAANVDREIKDRIAQVQASLQAELESKKAALRSRMEAESATARTRLEAKQKEVEAQIYAAEERIKKEMEKRMSELPDELKKQLEGVNKQIEEVTAQRDSLYEQMRGDLNAKVEKVAVQQKVPMVIGDFVVNRTCEDLTDRAMVAVKQMESTP